MAERLGITQQGYAQFEANPTKATLERLFVVLRLLGVEIELNQITPAAHKSATSSANAINTVKQRTSIKVHSAKKVADKAKPMATLTRKRESW